VLYTAVTLLWVQSQAAVEWAWSCSLPEDLTIRAEQPPPPLCFWFIPLCPRANQGNVSATLISVDTPESQHGARWLFRWRITNDGRNGVPLKVKIWTPEGVKVL
jgi:hypothetical protein